MVNIKPVKPIVLNAETAYLAGAIIGDGSVGSCERSDGSTEYRVSFTSVDRRYVGRVQGLMRSYTDSSCTIRKRARKRCYSFIARDKSFWYFLTRDMQVPAGKKSRCVHVPLPILFGSEQLQLAFLAGYFDTDGGRRGKTIGFCSASELLIRSVSVLLDGLGFSHFVESWSHKDYDHTYFGIQLHAASARKFLKEVPVQHIWKHRRLLVHAGVR